MSTVREWKAREKMGNEQSGKTKGYAALVEGRFLRNLFGFPKEQKTRIGKALMKAVRILDELIGTVTRYITLSRKKIDSNKIVFAAFQNTYTCNGKYIAEKMIEQNLGYDMVFIVDEEFCDQAENMGFPPQVRLVPRYSYESFLELATAKIWIDNALNCIWKGIPKRRDQIYLNTWHGSLGIKRLSGGKKWRLIAKHADRVIDYFITDSKFEEDVFRASFWPHVKGLKFGHARNDMFFDPEKMKELRTKVYQNYQLDEEVHTVLYAPTFRDNKKDISAIRLDCTELKNVLERKFGGKWQVITRLHFHNAKNENAQELFGADADIIDACAYPDIQELLAAVDIGITDYSSWIFDFVLTGKPAFIYAEDIEKYRNSRGFYYSLNDTPFMIADSNQMLENNIELFDEAKYLKERERFLKKMGCYEKGHAAERIVEYICSQTK